MKKRMRKKKQRYACLEYRGIWMIQGWAGEYSYTMPRSHEIMVQIPTAERYAHDFTEAKKCIDSWWSSSEARKYRHERKHQLWAEIPF